MTIDRTLMVEVVVPCFVGDDRPSREQMLEATQERWRGWKHMLDEGVYPTMAKLAKGVGVSRAAVTLGLRKLQG